MSEIERLSREEFLNRVKYDENGLVSTVIQDRDDGTVLMVGYMNAGSLRMTLEKGRVTFWSRSRRQFWTKGETSGNFLELRSIALDCDGDAILIKARPYGPTCHTGKRSCFSWALIEE